MAETTGISWTDSTFNPWIGCTKVGPGCDHCYAEAQDKRFGGDHWGVGKERKRTTPAYWRNLRKWNAKAEKFHAEHGHRQRVFIASQADVFDNAVPDGWRRELWAEIEACTDLEIIIVTKRVGNVEKMEPSDGFPTNAILLATVVNQAEYDRDEPKLSAIDVRVGLSVEPMLGPIVLGSAIEGLDWVICGGESGPNARPMHPDWPRALRDQCKAAGVPFFFKQWGEWLPESQCIDRPILANKHAVIAEDGKYLIDHSLANPPSSVFTFNYGKRRAGDFLDGLQHHEFPRVI